MPDPEQSAPTVEIPELKTPFQQKVEDFLNPSPSFAPLIDNTFVSNPERGVLRSVFADRENLGGMFPKVVADSKAEENPQEFRDTAANIKGLSFYTGRPTEEVTQNYEQEKQDFVKKMGWDMPSGEGQFRDQLARHFQSQDEESDARAGALSKISDQAWRDASFDPEGQSPNPVKAFTQWRQDHQTSIAGAPEDALLHHFQSEYLPIQKMASSPEGQVAKRIVDAITANTPENIAQGYNPEFPVRIDPVALLQDFLKQVPQEGRHAAENQVLAIASQYAKRLAPGDRGPLAELESYVKAFKQGAENHYGETHAMLKLEERMAKTSDPEKRQALTEERDRYVLADKVRKFTQGNIFPDPQYTGMVPQFLSQTLRMTAGTVPVMAPFFVPVIGEVLGGAAIATQAQSEAVFRRMAENPGMSATEAYNRSLVSTAFNVAATVPAMRLLGKAAPGLKAALLHMAGSTALMKSAEVEETAYRQFENLWNENVNAGQDFKGQYWEILKTTPYLFASLGLIGVTVHAAGLGQKSDPEVEKAVTEAMANPEALMMLGVPEERARAIALAPEGKRLQMANEALKERTPETMAAGIELAKEIDVKAKQEIQDPNAPKLTNNFNGTWTVEIPGKDGMTHLADFSTQEGALKAYEIAMQAHGEEKAKQARAGNDWTSATEENPSARVEEMPAGNEAFTEEKVSVVSDRLAKEFGGELPKNVEVVHDPEANWNAKIEGGKIQINAAHLSPEEAVHELHEELAHAVWGDEAARPAFEELWNALPQEVQDSITDHVERLYGDQPADVQYEETRAKAVKEILKNNPELQGAWDKFVQAIKAIWERISGGNAPDPEAIAARIVELGKAKVSGLDTGARFSIRARDDAYDPTKENGGVDGLKVKIKEFAESLPDPKSDEIKFHYEKDGIYGLVDDFFRKAFEMLDAKYDEHRASTGSTYIHISIPKGEGDTLENTQELDRENHKITIRDHDVSVFRAREFGSPTKTIKVDNFDTKENVLSAATRFSEHLSNIIEPYREYLSEKANPDAVSDTGVAGIKTDALSGEADKSDIPALREGKGSALTDSTLPQPDSDVNYSLRDKERDEAYDAAVKAGDEAEQQRLVDEAAKDAGYGIRAYHGTPHGDFQKFEDNGRGFFFTNKEFVAKGYTYKRGLWLSESPTGKVVNTHLKMDNPLEVDAMGARYNNIPFPGEEYKKTAFGNLPKNAISVEEAAKKAFEAGHDAVVIKNVMDAVDHDDKTRSTVYVVKSSDQIKSADPITRDDAGNVIPISQRFNAESNDIRFSKKDDQQPRGEKAKAFFTPDAENGNKVAPPLTFKDKAENTLSRIKGAMRDLPADSDFKRSLLQWSARSQQSTNEIERVQREIEKVVPDPIRRDGITNWIEAAGNKSTLRERSAASVDEKLKAGYEAALNLTPEEIAVANKVSDTFKILEARAKKYGIDMGHRENYVPHVYETEPQPPSGSSPKRLNEFFRFSQERAFENYFDAEQVKDKDGNPAPYKAQTKDIGKLLGLYMNDMNNAINSRRFVAEMHQSGAVASDGRPLVAPRGGGKTVTNEEGASTHLVYPDMAGEDSSDYKALDQPALHDWTFAGKTPEGVNTMVLGDLAVHPEIAKHLNNALSSSAISHWIADRSGNPLLNGVKSAVSIVVKGQGYVKGTMLSFSPFHQVQEGIHALGHRINPFAGLPQIDLRDPAQADAAAHGLMIAHDRLSQSLFMEGVGDNGSNLITMGLRKIGWGVSTEAANKADAYQHWLFSHYIPSLKFQTYTHILERNMERYKEELASGSATEWQVKNLSAHQANAAYGHLNYTDMGHNPTIRHAMQIALLAPDFLEARARFTGQALKGLAGGKVGAEQLQALAFLAITQFLSARIFNKLVNDDYDWDHPFEIRIGNKYYGLRSVPEDLYKLAHQPTAFIGGRISPVVGKFVQEGIFGVNYRGEKTSLGDALKDILTGMVPMPLQSMTRSWTASNLANPVSPLEQILGSAGIQVHRYSPITQIYPMAEKWKKANYPEDVQRGSYPVSKFQQLRYALEDNDTDSALKQVAFLQKQGMSHTQIAHAFKLSVNHPFTGNKEHDAEFLKTLDEDQRKVYDAAIERRHLILARFHKIPTAPAQ